MSSSCIDELARPSRAAGGFAREAGLKPVEYVVGNAVVVLHESLDLAFRFCPTVAHMHSQVGARRREFASLNSPLGHSVDAR